jgi:hypothetical protein
MKLPSVFKAGILPVIAGTAIVMASTVWAGDKSAVSGVGMELKPKVITQEKLDVHELDEQVSHMEVIDSNGNAYLLIPLKATGGSGPAVTKDGKIVVEYIHPYTGRLGN